MAKTLDQVPVISQGDTEMMAVDFTDLLDSGELLTGTPTVAEVTTSDLTIANVAVSTGSLTILGATVATGAAVQATISGQLSATGAYDMTVTATTDATPARTLVRVARFIAV
jgi:hypothetical protein